VWTASFLNTRTAPTECQCYTGNQQKAENEGLTHRKFDDALRLYVVPLEPCGWTEIRYCLTVDREIHANGVVVVKNRL